MRMIISFISECSLSYYFKIIISFWIFTYHPSIESHHQILIFFSTVITCTVLPHHISDSGSFSHSEVLYVFVALFVSYFYLSNDRQYVYWVDMDDIYGFVALSITCMNSNGHSR